MIVFGCRLQFLRQVFERQPTILAKGNHVRVFRLFVLLIFVLVLGFVAYTHQVLPNTSLSVKLFGPGREPKICAARARENFGKLEKPLNEISSTLKGITSRINSNDTDISLLFYHDTSEIFVDSSVREVGQVIELREAERISLIENFASMTGNYFAVSSIRQRDSTLVAYSFGTCGLTAVNWAERIIRIGFSPPPSVLAHIAFVRYPDHSVGDLICGDPFADEKEVFTKCEIRLSEDWVWSSEWWRLDLIIRRQPIDPD